MNQNHQALLNDGFFEDICLSLCAKTQAKPGQILCPMMRFHYTLHYILSGKGKVCIEQSSFDLHTGQGIFIPPNTYAKYEADTCDPWKYVWIGFSGKRVSEVLSAMNLNLLNIPFSCSFSDQIENLADKMLSSSKGTSDQIFLRQSLLLSLLSLLVHDQALRHIHLNCCKKTGINAYVADALDFISHHYTEPLQVQAIADHLGITRNYLFSLFKQEIHCSPLEYISNFRLSRACELLKQTEYSVDTISCSCGYSDPAVFSKAFKKKYGQTPSQYRRQ